MFTQDRKVLQERKRAPGGASPIGTWIGMLINILKNNELSTRIYPSRYK